MIESKYIVTPEMRAKLDAPLPAEAVSPHPTKSYLSSIKSIYITERLNDVFGVGSWCIASEVIDKGKDGMVVVKVIFTVPNYGISYECYGGNNNGGEGSRGFDLGDAYKGAVTDAITKIGSWLGIGAEVFKGKRSNSAPAPAPKPAPAPAPAPKPRSLVTEADLANNEKCDKLLSWMYGKLAKAGYPNDFDAGECLLRFYDADGDTLLKFCELFESYRIARLGK